MNEESHYKVTFSGHLVSGITPEQAKQNLAQLFKSSAAVIEKLFSGNNVSIKKNITKSQALTYQQAMHKAGAIANIEDMEQVESIELAPPPPVYVEEDDEDDLPPPSSSRCN